MKWFLDDGPLGYLARAFDTQWCWPAALLSVVEETATAAAQDRSGRRQRLLALRDGTDPCIDVVQTAADSDVAGMVLTYLRSRTASATQDLGEHVTIAHLALREPTGVFVTCDKGAAYLALSELGRARVSTPFDLWHWLEGHRHIDGRCRQDLCDMLLRSDARLPGVPRRLAGPATPGP